MKTITKIGVLCGGAVLLAGAGYGVLAAATWLRFDRGKSGKDDEESRLDLFMPRYQIIERYGINIDAPADRAFTAVSQLKLEDACIVRAIFRTREWFLGSRSSDATMRPGLVAQAKLWGWGVLKESPEEIIFGAVTQPWVAHPVFRALKPEEFAAYDTPGYVKIVWSLKVQAVREDRSILSTETRATTTDEVSRARFRDYWAFVMPGTAVIRRVALRHAKRLAERSPAGS